MHYRSDENSYLIEKGKKILLDYHRNRISRAEFCHRMRVLYGEPENLDKFFGSEKKEEKMEKTCNENP